VSYREGPIGVRGTLLWSREVAAADRSRILPDGCMDLLWDGAGLLVAGPDTAARWHTNSARASYVALRFAGGTGPALVGIAAHEVRDRVVPLAQLWPDFAARRLTEQVAADPARGLAEWATARAAQRPVDPLGPRVLAMARAGFPVSEMADELALSTRQLHRRCVPVFGYGPSHLTRIVRLGGALAQARGGTKLAEVASITGYADQAHLSRDVRALTGARLTDLLAELATG
jgi:AraC-like DNA-binding protein